MRYAITLAVLGLVSAKANAGVSETRIPLGKYHLIEEVSVLGADEVPIMHVNQNWTKLHLRFVTADNATKIDIVDDGAKLEIAIDSAGCLSRSWPIKYGDDRTGKILYLQTEKTVKELFKLCTTLLPEQKTKHLAEFRAARSDFPAALDGLKARAIQVFGGWRVRCIRYSKNMPGSPFWEPDCVRFSSKGN